MQFPQTELICPLHAKATQWYNQQKVNLRGEHPVPCCSCPDSRTPRTVSHARGHRAITVFTKSHRKVQIFNVDFRNNTVWSLQFFKNLSEDKLFQCKSLPFHRLMCLVWMNQNYTYFLLSDWQKIYFLVCCRILVVSLHAVTGTTWTHTVRSRPAVHLGSKDQPLPILGLLCL